MKPAPPFDPRDVVILGGGPAGCAAALTLTRAGRRVTVLERSHFDTERIGETLPPGALAPLAQLGVPQAMLEEGHLPSPGTVSVWGGEVPYENDFIFNPHGNGWHLDRRRFDEGLACAAVAAGAHVLQDARLIECDQLDDGHWAIFARIHGTTVQLRAQWIIDATGRSAWLARRRNSVRMVHDRLIAVVGFFEQSSTPDHRTFLEACPEGWWYSTALPGDRIIAAYFTDADLFDVSRPSRQDRWFELLGETRLIGQRLARCRQGGGRLGGPLRVASASTTISDPFVGDGWLAVGDAACTLDPLSSHGIVWAIDSALEGARALLDASPHTAGARYADRIALRFRDYLRTRQMFYARERRWPYSAFWQRRQDHRSTHEPAFATSPLARSLP